MAKTPTRKAEPVAPLRLETVVGSEVTVVNRLGPEKFEVISGRILGSLEEPKVLESGVSLRVALDSANRSVNRQHEERLARLRKSVGG